MRRFFQAVAAPACVILFATCGETEPSAGVATRLLFAAHPSAVTAGNTIAPAVKVRVVDAEDRTVTGSAVSITIAITGSTGTAGAVLGGTLTRPAVAGVATFSDLSIDKPGSGYTLRATAGTLTPDVSVSFAVSAAAPIATGLAFVVEPARTEPGDSISPGVQVAILDQFGQPHPTATSTVALTLGGIPSGATLTGTTTVQAIAGIATFPDLSIDQAGSGYTLVATSAGLTGAITTSFDIGRVFVAITAGGRHTCGLGASGTAWCWGDNSSGQLGDGSTIQRTTPTPVGGSLQFVELTAGYEHTCGITIDSAGYCWGANTTGQLGDSTNAPRDLPSPVAGALDFLHVSAGYNHTCGITSAHLAYCWGRNDLGQLGDSSGNPTAVPARVAGGLLFTLISTRIHTCAVASDNTAYCWGRNVEGQLGDGAPTHYRNTPTPVASPIAFSSVSVGDFHTCGITTNNIANCWGEGWTPSPTQVLPPAFIQLDAGAHHTCGVNAASVALCWGTNVYGELGDGTLNGHDPLRVAGTLPFAEVSAGNVHSCGTTTGRITYCWGYNFYGGLGDGTTVNRLIPTRVAD